MNIFFMFRKKITYWTCSRKTLSDNINVWGCLKQNALENNSNKSMIQLLADIRNVNIYWENIIILKFSSFLQNSYIYKFKLVYWAIKTKILTFKEKWLDDPWMQLNPDCKIEVILTNFFGQIIVHVTWCHSFIDIFKQTP